MVTSSGNELAPGGPQEQCSVKNNSDFNGSFWNFPAAMMECDNQSHLCQSLML